MVNYHRFEEPRPTGEFRLEWQCRHLRESYNPIPLDRLVDSLKNETPLPPRSIVVTIDDGYRDIYTRGYPVFKKYGIPVTAYVVSGFLARECWLWWDKIGYALERCRLEQVELPFPDGSNQAVSLTDAAARGNLAVKLSVGALVLPDRIRLDLVDEITRRLQVTVPEIPPLEYEALRWEEAREMAEAGVIEIGSHSMFHPILGTIDDSTRRAQEITGSKRQIEAGISREVKHFCVPNGGKGDFSQLDLREMKQAGYASNATTFIGFNFRNTNPYLLRRISVDPFMTEQWYRIKVAGVWRLMPRD